MSHTAAGHTTGRYAWIYKAIVFLLMALYLVSCLTPLRLEYDSIRYFAIKDCLDVGCAPDSRAAKDFLPYGYPVLLLLLSKLGLLKSFFIALINGIYLLGSLYFIKKIIAPANQYFLFFIVVMLHWTFIKLFAYPLSEMQYLFFSSASLYFYNRYGQSRNWLFLVLSFAFAILSTFTRTVGIALIVTLFAAFVWKNRKIFNSKANQLRIFIAVALFIVAAFFAFTKMPELKHYISAFPKNALENSYKAGMTSGHFKEWGQLLLNVPTSKIENYFPVAIVSFVFIAAGIVFFLWFVYMVFKMRNSISGTVIIYLVIYTVIIFNWPYFDPRFWVPILPFIIAITLQSSFDKIKLPKVLTPFFLFIYISMGAFAFGYSLYTEFSKKTFARSQAKGIFRNEYEIHFFGKPLSDTAKHVDKDVVELLEKYDR
jgi:hypothetical protein